MIAILIFLSVDAYLCLSLLNPLHQPHPVWFWGSAILLQTFAFSQLWLYFFFFKSTVDQDLHFEKPLQSYAFYSMGMQSFLLVFTLLRDLLGGLFFLFHAQTILYGVTPSFFILGLSVLCFTVGLLIARFKVVSPLVEIPIAGIPSALKGLKIIQLSDVHLGTGPGKNHVADMVNRALSLRPDLIVLTGDIIDGMISEIGPELQELARLRAPHGVYFILGNHECYWKWPEAVEAMKKIGITPLLNEGKTLEIHGVPIFIAGINDPATGSPIVIPTPPAYSRLNIALVHQPQFSAQIARVNPAYHLQLSGHTHGGQFFPWNLVVDQVYPISKGLGRIENLWVYVNQGTGYWGPPIRLGTAGEVTHLVIENETAAIRLKLPAKVLQGLIGASPQAVRTTDEMPE